MEVPYAQVTDTLVTTTLLATADIAAMMGLILIPEGVPVEAGWHYIDGVFTPPA